MLANRNKLFQITNIPVGFSPDFDQLINPQELNNWNNLKAHIHKRIGKFEMASEWAYTSAGNSCLKLSLQGKLGSIILTLSCAGFTTFPKFDNNLSRFYVYLTGFTDVFYFAYFLKQQLAEESVDEEEQEQNSPTEESDGKE